MSHFADLPTISLSALYKNDEVESSRLFNVCKTHGFFYLDYTNSPSWSASCVNDLFDLGHKFFALPEHEKMKISMESSGTYFGYKPHGANVVDSAGTRDQNEFFNISKEDILHGGLQLYRSHGLVSDKVLPSCRNFVSQSHDILTHMLTILSTMLHLEGNERLEALHRKEGKSGDHMRLVKYTAKSRNPTTEASSPSQVSVMLIPHTDFGSLTLLLSNQPGLQLMDPDSNAWKFVEPRPSRAIVNAGDALAKFSNGLFKACQHRVVEVSQTELELFGNDAMTSKAPKYSLGYFLRPEDNVPLRRLNSDLIPELADPGAEVQILSKDWEKWRVNSAKAHNYGRTYAWDDLKGTALVWT